MAVLLTFDVEQDLHSSNYKSLEFGIPKLLSLLNKHNIKATFFVPAKLIKNFPDLFISLGSQGHEIALHGYEHERFDDLTYFEKENRIKKSLTIYTKIFKKLPKGFRTPQHSIDEETLKILNKHKFSYDSSYTPFNILQLFFFPKKFKLWLKGFFSPRDKYKLMENFYEIPTSSFLIPFVSLPLRIFPWLFLKIYLAVLKFTNKNLVFYAHSWDFIDIPKSRIDNLFSNRKLYKNLDKTITYLNKDNKFLRVQELLNEKN